ncbi:MAG: PhoH family protein [Candidatus Omnitrophica bacterium]|nr:PhoH family protein [Candidatus Omnitrophota bacterium]
MEKIITIDDFSYLTYICGPKDENLKYLQKLLELTVNIEPQGILLRGARERVESAENIIKKIYSLAKEGINLSHEELRQMGQSQKDSQRFNSNSPLPGSAAQNAIPVPSARKKQVFPKTSGQSSYIEAIKKYDIVFSIGPAGTGKTYLAMAMAVNYLMQKNVRRIILTRPALEAGESLGFLPGDMHEKLSPYLRPLYDALYDMTDVDVIENHLETGIIEIVPLAYMRGRTLNNAFVILDEAQNCTADQLRMFLTRLGFDTKTVITGDITQSDLPGGKPLGLIEASKLLKSIKGIKFVNLTKKDVVRHPLIQKIIMAYETYYSKKTN